MCVLVCVGGWMGGGRGGGDISGCLGKLKENGSPRPDADSTTTVSTTAELVAVQ
jgi:hypothetical protein